MSVYVRNASGVDHWELDRLLGSSVVSQEDDTRGDDFGEPTSITIVITALPLLAASFTAWVARARRSRAVELEYDEDRPDGTSVRQRIRIKESSADALDAESLKTIAKAFGTTPSELAKELAEPGTQNSADRT